MKVPLARPSLGEEEKSALSGVIDSRWITYGPRTKEFEQAFAAAVDARFAVAVSSGTAALHLGLYALGIGPGDEVVVPSCTFIATADAVTACGARPVFSDVDPRTRNMDLSCFRAALTERTKAVIIVDQLGLPSDCDSLASEARKRGILIVQDSACALGSTYRGRPVGCSDAWPSCFSFHPRKLISTGEGGMITTGDEELALRLKSLRNHGINTRRPYAGPVADEYLEPGFNYFMSDLQGAVGLVQLGKLDSMLDARIQAGLEYDRLLADLDGISTPVIPSYATRWNRQSYQIDIDAGRDARDFLIDFLADRGVETRWGVMSCHLEASYRPPRGLAKELPGSERSTNCGLILPLYPEITKREIDYVVKCLARGLEAFKARQSTGRAKI